MTRVWWMALVSVVAFSWTPVGPAKAQDAKSAGGAPAVSSAQRLRVKKVTFGIGHRAFAEFYDEQSTRVGEEFPVGATNYRARVLRFEPDFTMDQRTRQIYSKSNSPDNPAFQIATLENGVPHDTSWAFLNFPPHFGKKSLLAFKVLRIEFENHAPVTPKPMSAMPGMPGMPGAAGGAPRAAQADTSRGARR